MYSDERSICIYLRIMKAIEFLKIVAEREISGSAFAVEGNTIRIREDDPDAPSLIWALASKGIKPIPNTHDYEME